MPDESKVVNHDKNPFWTKVAFFTKDKDQNEETVTFTLLGAL